MKNFFKRCLYVLIGIAGAFGGFRCFAAGGDSVSAQPKVSVIVPVYNVEKYLPECLDSLINQTLRDIEIICVDDGSKDNSLQILNEYARKDNRIKVIHKENGGLSSARNAGIEIAIGKYLAFVDSDDFVDTNTYERTYDEVEKNNADILCFGWKNFPVGHGREDCCPKNKVYHDWFTAKRTRESIHAWNKLYKSSFIKDNNLRFNEKSKCTEDECFNLCAYPLAKTIVHISDKLYNYRYREGSLVFTNVKKRLEDYVYIWKYVFGVWKTYNIPTSIYFKLITYPATYSGEYSDFFRSWFPKIKVPSLF